MTVLLVIAVGGFGYFFWHEYVSPSPDREFAEFQKRYVVEMTADTYGGKTPQETLNLFIDALEKGDADLAAKYFMLDDKLSRDQWVKSLEELKRKDLLDDMARDLKKVKGMTGDDENDFGFELYDNTGVVSALIDMQLNTYSEVWKIEDL